MTTLTYTRERDPDLRQALEQRQRRQALEQRRQRLARQLDQAGLPPVFRRCSFTTLDPSQTPEAVAQARVYAEAVAAGTADPPGLLLLGRPGRGKSSLAAAILRQVVERTHGRYSVRFWNVARGLEQQRDRFRQDDGPGEGLQELLTHRLVVLDDWAQPRLTAWVAEQFYTLIDGLWAGRKAVILTTHVPLEALRARFDEALLSRLLGMCEVVFMAGPDRRLETGGREGNG